MDYKPGVLSGRRIYWCPDNEGHLPFCPSPTDPDDHVYCCQFFYLGDSFPSCCRFPIYTGLLIALIISAVILALLIVFLYCWFWPNSRLNARRREAHRRSTRANPSD